MLSDGFEVTEEQKDELFPRTGKAAWAAEEPKFMAIKIRTRMVHDNDDH